MALDFQLNATDGEIVEVRVSGDLTLGPHLRRFSDKLSQHVTKCRPSALLLDLSHLATIDSAGLGELVILYTTASEHNCRLGLVNPSTRIVRLLQATRLDGLLPRFESMASARHGS